MEVKESYATQREKSKPGKTLRRLSSSNTKLNDTDIASNVNSTTERNVPDASDGDMRRYSSHLCYLKSEGSSEFLKSKSTKEFLTLNFDRMHQEASNDSFNFPPVRRNIEPVTRSQLNTLIEQNSNELLLTILDEKSGILSLINERNITEDLMPHMLMALGKACSSDLHKNMNDLIKNISCNNKHLLINIQQYLGAFRKREKLEKYHFDSIFYLVEFLEKFQHFMPSSSSDFVSILLPLLRFITERCFKNHGKEYVMILEKLETLDSENRRFFEQFSLNEIKNISKKEKLHMQDPPENFRSLTILPTMQDLSISCKFLRPNIVNGKYIDTEHYLDVQFRLLREDYVMPLRDGVAEYLYHKKSGKYFKGYKNVRVYSDIRIVGEDFVNGELIHLLQFPNKNFSKINWERNKRFLTGSLLCLSSDDFQNILLATVAVRDPRKLKQGLLYIHFEEMAEAIVCFHQTTNFVVLETTTGYFQAYCHNLKALLQLHEEKLPFKSYIIDVEKRIDKPQYLVPSITYDMRPLLIPLNKKYIKFSMTKLGKYDYPGNIVNTAQSLSVLNDDDWPSALDLNLDNSQYMALKTAVTKELAIIQGPPGTGKTFIGLRIAQLLLHNTNKWFCEEENSLPILVVCYTNHALDQFLEGLLIFTDKIVRIGGRGSNKVLSNYQLKILKSNHRWKIPRHIRNDKQEKTMELEILLKEINSVKYCIETSSKTVLNENELKKYIPYFHLLSLKMGYTKQPLGKNIELTIYDWLNICSATAKHMKTLRSIENYNCEVLNSRDPCWIKDKEFESEDEADIEYTENQRNIDYYDLNDSSYNSNLKTYDELNDEDDSYLHNQSNKKYRKTVIKHIRNWLRNSEIMNESDALKVKNVWNLNYTKRWQLYKFWLQRFIEDKKKQLRDLQEELKIVSEEIKELRYQEDLHILQGSHVVGMTTTGAAMHAYIVQRLNPAILIVEEAAELLESHIITSLAPKTKHMILIGDHKQLRPSTSVHMLSVKYNMDISLFERMINNGIGHCTLSIQHRMRPEISALIVPHIYPSLENDPSVNDFENVKGLKKNVYFVTHGFRELQESDSQSKVNDHEAKFLIQLCRYLLLQGYDASEITVLTIYSGQLSTLQKFKTPEMKDVRFTVVDNFQGEENNIILISFVRSNEQGEIGFLKVPNRVCVALSRAKKGLYCIGNFELLAKKSNLWKNIIGTLTKNKSIGTSLELICQNHPDVCNKVSTETDFTAVSNGGCSRKCNYRLSCGHCCPLNCHPYDHESVRCVKPCTKSCEAGHPCKKLCYESCGLCLISVDKTLQYCGHTMKASCYKKESEVLCTFECEKILDCTHRCTNKCGLPCVENCKEPCLKICEKGHRCVKKCSDICGVCDQLVERKLSRCGHTVMAACGKNENEIRCTFKCDKILPCTHQCINMCGDNCVDSCRFPCTKTCDKGHPCQKLCSEKCFCTFLVEKTVKICTHNIKVYCGKSEEEISCSFKCEKVLRCSHNCTNKCGEPCVEICRQMKEVASPICGHLLNVECYFTDDPELLFKVISVELFQLCLEPCNALLPCGHTCKGTCGSCYQGRLHVACNELCNRILLCGHKCRSKCAKSCPPCIRPCENSCIHKKCSRKCSDPCIKCTESCEWSCKHKQCTRLCNEICSREACDEPCSLILSCNHPCSGFCGESCPDKCKICEENNSVCTSSKETDYVKYILLEDCKHSIEVQNLNNHMIVKTETEIGLKLKTCPECNTVIRKNFRYGKEIKTSLYLLEAVKMTYSSDAERSMKIQNSLYCKLMQSAFHSKSLYKSLGKALTPYKKNRNIQKFTNIENVYNIISDFESSRMSKSISDFNYKSPVLQSLWDFERITCLWLGNFIEKQCTEMSEYQLLQMTFEILRLKLINKLLKYAETLQMKNGCPSFEDCALHLLNYSSFDRKNVKAFISAFRNLTSQYGGSDSDKSLILDFPFLKGMNMSCDSWNQCSNGHVFCNMALFKDFQKKCNVCFEIENGKKMLPISQRALSIGNARRQLHRPRSEISHSEDSLRSEAVRKHSTVLKKTSVRSETWKGATSRNCKYGFKFGKNLKDN